MFMLNKATWNAHMFERFEALFGALSFILVALSVYLLRRATFVPSFPDQRSLTLAWQSRLHAAPERQHRRRWPGHVRLPPHPRGRASGRASGAAAAQDMQREFGRLGLRQDARKRRDRHDDVDTSLVPVLLRKQIDVEITAGNVL